MRLLESYHIGDTTSSGMLEEVISELQALRDRHDTLVYEVCEIRNQFGDLQLRTRVVEDSVAVIQHDLEENGEWTAEEEDYEGPPPLRPPSEAPDLPGSQVPVRAGISNLETYPSGWHANPMATLPETIVPEKTLCSVGGQKLENFQAKDVLSEKVVTKDPRPNWQGGDIRSDQQSSLAQRIRDKDSDLFAYISGPRP